jgi:KDO2-lipid IV(A) lauroyltransferase
LKKENISQRVRMEGGEHLSAALDHKKGVLMLTLHLGHGDLAVASLSLFGFPMVLVSKFFKLKWLNDLWFGMREKLGTEFIPPRNSSFQLLKKLKAGKVVVIPLDQFTGPPIGVRTTFFGQETGTAAGLALMAVRSQARVVPAYTFRDADGIHQIRILPEVDMERFKHGEDPSYEATQHFNHLLEDIVRKHPEQWMWIHRRWKKFVVQ